MNETIGAYGLTEAATITVDPAQELEDAVYSTMRGRYQVAIDTTRDAVLSAPELFAPGQTDLDKYQLH